MNSFAALLQNLPDEATRACLQAVCLGRGSSLSQLEAAAQAGPLRPHLERLVDLDLVAFQEGQWRPTWSGRGVYNWHQQLSWADAIEDSRIPEPRPEENGDQVVAGCNDYRPFYGCPGYCWCGIIRSQHVSEAPKTAAKLLAHYRKEKRSEEM